MFGSTKGDNGMALLLVFQSVVVPPFLGWADKTGIQFLQMQFLLKKAMMMDEAEVSQSLSKTFFWMTRSVTNAEMRERNDSFFFFAIPSMFLAHFK